MKIIKLDSSRVVKALETIRYTKKPQSFISASVAVGEEQGKIFKETLDFNGDEVFPIFYKLRDSRYGIIGFKKEFPNALYFPVVTYRYGEGYSNVNVELKCEAQIAGGELLGFYDPMVSRGTTAVNTISGLCKSGPVETLSSFHFFAADQGLNKLDLELQKFFLKDYIVVLGMRGFQVDTSGYMGAILREQDYGDVMEGTYWNEYPPEVEQNIVENGIFKGAYLEIVMGYILYILLKHQYARYSNSQLVPKSLKELATANWMNVVFCYLQQNGAEIPVNNWEMRHLRAGVAVPISPTISEALRQMRREWLIDMEKEVRNRIEYNVYYITPWGDSYLKKIYLPVFGRSNLLNNFVPVLEEVTPEIITGKFHNLLKKLDTQRAKAISSSLNN